MPRYAIQEFSAYITDAEKIGETLNILNEDADSWLSVNELRETAGRRQLCETLSGKQAAEHGLKAGLHARLFVYYPTATKDNRLLRFWTAQVKLPAYHFSLSEARHRLIALAARQEAKVKRWGFRVCEQKFTLNTMRRGRILLLTLRTEFERQKTIG